VADIFVSYTSSDRDWAFWIANELQALGHVPHVHEWEIRGGEDIYAWMVQRSDAADHMLCIISDEYLRAPYSTLERNAALWQAAGKRPGFVLLVAVKPCTLPMLSDHIRRCELYGVSQDTASTRFREFMARRGARAVIAFPGEEFAVSNIPIRVPTHFLGREDSLAAIDTALGRHEGRVAITALHGLRGVGKTTLAAAYAERSRGHHRATWWIRAQTEAGMRADLVGLGARLKWVAPEEKEEAALTVVMERLRHEGAGILLIYDNAADAEALQRYLPRGGAARVLVTSNSHAWRGLAEPVEIGLWPMNIGAEYLLSRTGRAAERAAAEALSDALGGLPLAHEQAAAFCERLDMSFADYRRRFEATPARFLDDSRHAPPAYHDGLTVAKTFALAIDKAASLHSAAEPLIAHVALLAPEPVPLFLFSEAREKFAEPFASALADDGLIEAVAALRAFALVDRESIADERDPVISTDCIRLHRLVRQVAAMRREGDAHKDALCAHVHAMAAVYPGEEVFNTATTWPRARRLDALAVALVGDATLPAGAEARAADLMYCLAGYRHGALAAYAQARLLHERALAIREQVLGPGHPDTAASLNDLALLLEVQGDLAGAQPLCERALAIREQALGPEHPETAHSLNNLAMLLQAQGDLAGARPLHERALVIKERVLGPDHPDTATTLDNLAALLQAEGDLAGARRLIERALAISERALGLEHPDTAMTLDNLAALLQAQGDFAGARPLVERALAINERVLGPEHPDTATTLDNLAALLQAEGELAGAQARVERALAIREKVLGPEHPETARSLSNLAFLLQFNDDLAGAQPLLERVLAIREKVLGPEHPETATTLDNLAALLQAVGDLSRARRVGERALAIREKVLGPDHPDTANGLDTLAALVEAQGDLAAARLLYERALATREEVLGLEHPDTATSLNNVAAVLQAQGDLMAARPLYQRALAISETVLGAEHPDTATSLNNLARLLQAQGDLTAARPLYERALAIYDKALDPQHPDSNRARCNFATLLLGSGSAGEALALGEFALAAHESGLGPDHPWTKDSARVTAGALAMLGRIDEAAELRERLRFEDFAD
jgi:tetratricopeptide (TPR) repeat protein